MSERRTARADRARAIVSDVIGRPLASDANELSSFLPAGFFDNQDALEAHAAELAADAKQAFAVASAYGRVSETCVRCHAAYRAGR